MKVKLWTENTAAIQFTWCFPLLSLTCNTYWRQQMWAVLIGEPQKSTRWYFGASKIVPTDAGTIHSAPASYRCVTCKLRKLLSLASYHIISYHIISYHIISYRIISYHIISSYIISYHVSYHIISNNVRSRKAAVTGSLVPAGPGDCNGAFSPSCCNCRELRVNCAICMGNDVTAVQQSG